ncbi:MAG: hypothetical protein HY718_08940 [Planctomycetes bacterium]|nr:hypothetical protein [Planctomycetota bacterium]
MMGGSLRAILRGHVLGLVMIGALPGVGAVRVLAQDTVEDCSPTDEAKAGLCGHALAEIERFESGKPPGGLPITLEAQADTDITHCFLDIVVRTDTSPKRIEGTNTLDAASLAAGLAQMTLDLDGGMTVDAVKVNGVAAAYTRPTNQIAINLGAAYDVGQAFQVQVTYHGTPRSRTDQFSFDFFSTQTNGQDVIAASFSQPFYAKYWWPCKDNNGENSDKFTLDLHVTVPDTMTVAANGVLQGVDTLAGNRKKYRWHEGYPIVTYLVSFAATHYTKITRYYEHVGGYMPVEFYIYPDQVGTSEPYLDTVVQAITTFSLPSLYGQYPFINEKYGIAQFQWCCGMEHQTMTSQGAYTSENRNVHELAHQWWGDYVTCKTWHDIWLNEGFARFSEALFKEKRPGGSYASYLAHLNANRPSTTGTGTVYRYDISTTSAIFSTTYSYNKGAWVTHMLRRVLADQPFFTSLIVYRNAFAGGAADTEDFRAVCESVVNSDLGWFFSQWVYNAGAPYYRYGWEAEQIGGQNWVRLHVQQYQKTVVSSFPNAMKMPIDVTLTTGTGSTTRRIWNDATGTGNTVTEWFLLPADGPVTSVQFDKDTWILRGAATNVAYVPGPPKIVAAAPSPQANVPTFPGVAAVTLNFSEPVACTSAHFSVAGSLSGPHPFLLSRDATHLTATLSFDRPLPNGQTWTVQIAETVSAERSGLALDGEIAEPLAAALPSGDGLPGGAAILTFTIKPFAPDLDRDNDVDDADLLAFEACLTGPGAGPPPAECESIDFDGDGDVDQSDFGPMQGCLNGPDAPPDPNCLAA